MKFFTPELYLQFNSPDDEVADRADQAWEKAVEQYRQHLEELRDRLPQKVAELANLCLHDAEFISLREETEPLLSCPPEPFLGPFWSAFAFLSLAQGQQITVLLYVLRDHIRKLPPIEGWNFSKEKKHWLYDEMDVADGQGHFFVHRILCSDGVVVEIPFVSVITNQFGIPNQSAAELPRKTA